MRYKKGSRLRLGFIGCGHATSELHLPALRHVPEVEVLALADVDDQRLQAAGDRFRVSARYRNSADLLDDPRIEAVAVCVPPQQHVDLALAVLDAGKHLFVEKPLALSLADCDRLIERASQSRCKSQVGFNLRQHALVRQARKIIQGGELGEVEALRSCFTAATRRQRDLPAWRNQRESGGGVLTEIATHHFDLWRFLLGTDVKQVFVDCRSDRTDDVAATVIARMADGVSVSGVFSERTFGSNELEIFGREGWLRLNLYRFDGFENASIRNHSGDLGLRLRQLWRTISALPGRLTAKLRGVETLNLYQRQWRRFANAVLREGPIDATLQDGRAAAAVAAAAIESAATGQPAEVACRGVVADGVRQPGDASSDISV